MTYRHRHQSTIIVAIAPKAIGIFRVTASRFMTTQETIWAATVTASIRAHVEIPSFVMFHLRTWTHTYDPHHRMAQLYLLRNTTTIVAVGENSLVMNTMPLYINVFEGVKLRLIASFEFLLVFFSFLFLVEGTYKHIRMIYICEHV